MDPLAPALLAVLTQIGEGSLGAAGAQLWQSLRALVKRRDQDGGAELPQLSEGVPATPDLQSLAEALAIAAEDDSSLAGELAEWLSRARSVTVQGNVSNSVGGSVSGTVIQIGNVKSERSD